MPTENNYFLTLDTREQEIGIYHYVWGLLLCNQMINSGMLSIGQ